MTQIERLKRNGIIRAGDPKRGFIYKRLDKKALLKDDMARVLRELLKCRKSEVFKYQSDDGQFIDIKRRDINDYIKEVMGRSFSAKDGRF